MALVKALGDRAPRIASGVFLAETAVVVGDVEIAEGASVWYGAVLRADVGRIRIGARTNIQDLACIHMTGGLSHSEVGAEVTIGHGAIVHGATIADGVLIGMGSVILDNAEIGEEAMVAAVTVVPPNLKVPPRMLVRGVPGKIIRELEEDERIQGRRGASVYMDLARRHRG
jgi:carbonic anhydrase/acetyltransferase-like protein (isoleucine patch superfamily)